ncbi:MAG TPA: PPC domain-containing DNA-binding protein [Actinomycetota bacterium]
MNVKIIEHGDRRTHVVRLESNETLVASLAGLVRQAGIKSGTLRGRGRLSRLTVMRLPPGDATTVPCPADLVLLEGDVILEGAEPSVALQALVVCADGSVTGGRVAEATADSCEITIEEAPSIPMRTLNASTGAAFADLAAGEPRTRLAGAGAVDEAGEESFPASDPPSFAGVPAN